MSGWRLRYGELIEVPIEDWPEGARTYPLEDARATLEVFLAQQVHADYMPDEYRQSRAAWALHLCSVWGLRTDRVGVEKLEAETLASLAKIEDDLKAAGLVRSDGSRNTKLAQKLIVEVCDEQGITLRLTEGGAPSLDADACEASGDETLKAYAELTSLKTVLNKDIPVLKAGSTYPVHTSYGMAASARVTSARPNVQNPRRLVGIREAFIPRAGKVFAQADFSALELHTLAQFCIRLCGYSELAIALNKGRDPHTEVAVAILGISYEAGMALKKSGDKQFDNARQAAKVCFHPDTEILTQSGWVKIPDVTTDTIIAVPSLSDNSLSVRMSWDKPLRVTKRNSLELVRVHNKSMDIRVTPDHNMAGWVQTNYRDGRRVLKEKSLKATETNLYKYIPSAGNLVSGSSRTFPRRFVRMLVATQADGSYTSSGKIRFGFTEERKIKRFRWLFEGFYEEGASSQGATTFTVGKELASHIMSAMPNKQLVQEMLSWDYVSRLVLVRESRFWDGHTFVKKDKAWSRGTSGWSYCSTIEHNTNILSALAATTGYKSSVQKYARHGEFSQDAYVLSIKRRSYTRGGNVSVDKEAYCGPVHCLTTRTGFVLIRSGGKTAITRQCNFGFPGGLGFSTLVLFARKNYEVILTEAQAKELKAVWVERWPEMQVFFAHVSELIDRDSGEATIEQLFSKRIRGGCHYTAACNSFFQGLGADAAKRATYLVSKACYAETDSVLYGSRIVNMVHDELIVEVDDDERAHDKAMELERLMVKGANEFLPEVPARTEPLLARCWSKSAKPTYKDGRLIPWTP
jgi:hypothetical protein